jgi:hypothetical protein
LHTVAVDVVVNVVVLVTPPEDTTLLVRMPFASKDNVDVAAGEVCVCVCVRAALS